MTDLNWLVRVKAFIRSSLGEIVVRRQGDQAQRQDGTFLRNEHRIWQPARKRGQTMVAITVKARVSRGMTPRSLEYLPGRELVCRAYLRARNEA